MNWYFGYLCFALLVGVLIGMMLCWHVGDCNNAIGELIIGEKNSEDWPYLSLSLDEEVEDFEQEEYIVLRVNKLDMTREKHRV